MKSKPSNLNALKGICNQIYTKCNCEIYTEKIPQGFKEPCFFIETVNTTQRRIGYNRYERRQSFCIHYFPKNPHNIGNIGEVEDVEQYLNIEEDVLPPINQCLEMAESLYTLLENIKINGNGCRGTNMNHSISEEVLHFNVDYNYHLLVEKEEPIMKNLNQKGGLKSDYRK